MKKIIRAVILAIIIILGVIAIRITYNQQGITFLSDWLDFFPFYFLIAIGIISFLIEQHYFFASKKWKEFAVTAVAAIFCTIISIPLLRRELTDNAGLLLEVSGRSNNEYHLMQRFQFKNNKRFRLIEGQGTSSVLYYGTFLKKGDTIVITGSNYDTIMKLPRTGVIKKDTVFWDNSDTMLLIKPVSSPQ